MQFPPSQNCQQRIETKFIMNIGIIFEWFPKTILPFAGIVAAAHCIAVSLYFRFILFIEYAVFVYRVKQNVFRSAETESVRTEPNPPYTGVKRCMGTVPSADDTRFPIETKRNSSAQSMFGLNLTAFTITVSFSNGRRRFFCLLLLLSL